MPTRREVSCEVTVQIVAADEAPSDWLSRVGDADFPYSANGRPMTTAEGMEHLAFNAIANGVQDAHRLDGWADLAPGMVTMDVTSVEAL